MLTEFEDVRSDHSKLTVHSHGKLVATIDVIGGAIYYTNELTGVEYELMEILQDGRITIEAPTVIA